jgi:hypothetical protein
MTNIILSKDIESDNAAEIHRYLDPFQWVIPQWLRTLHILIEGSQKLSSVATTTVDEQYREACIKFRPTWFTMTPDEKQDAVLHELMHIHTNPMFDYATNAIERYSSEAEDKHKDIVTDELRTYLERVTQDLTNTILDQFGREQCR